MSGTVVVDASVAVKWLVKEEDVESALRLLQGASEIRAPKLILGEVANAVWKKVRRKEISADTGVEALEFLAGYIAILFDTDDLLGAALRMACALDHPIYDCLYVESARRLDLPLVTADARLIRKLAGSTYGRHILPLSEWRA